MAPILYQTATHYVIKAPKAYEVYRNAGVAAERRAIIGLSLGLARAIAECDKRSAWLDAGQIVPVDNFA